MTARGRATGPLAGPAATRAFARGIAARHAARATGRSLRFVFLRRRSRTALLQPIVQRVEVAVALRLLAPDPRRMAARPAARRGVERAPASPAPHAALRPPPLTATAARGADRGMSPARRAAALPADSGRTSGRPVAPTALARAAARRGRTVVAARGAPPPATARRPSAGPPPAAAPAAATRVPPVPPARAPGRSAAVERSAMPEPRVDIAALTDSVVRAIDERIAARRERFGRG